MVDIVGIVNDIANEGNDVKVMNVENAGTVTKYHRLFRQIPRRHRCTSARFAVSVISIAVPVVSITVSTSTATATATMSSVRTGFHRRRCL